MSTEDNAAPVPAPQPNQTRKTASISKKLAWGAGSMSMAGFLGISAALYERFYSKEEGLAVERNVARIEQAFDAKLTAKSEEIKEVINLRFDEVLRTMASDTARRDKIDDKQDILLDNLKLIVMGTKQNNAKKEN